MIEYELMYIVPASMTEEEAGAVEQAVGVMLQKAQATDINTTKLGKFRLAYGIRRQTHGHYMLVRFKSEAANVAGLNESLRLSPDKVLRHIILKAEEAGGAKFNLVQFQEVNTDERGDRARKPRSADKKEEPGAAAAQKEGVAALEGGEKSTAVEAISSEDLDKKIDAALEEKA
jgi:ribosomal protein S6